MMTSQQQAQALIQGMPMCRSLSEAVWQCDIAKVRQFLDQGADPNKAHNGESPLLPAARLGSAECVHTLLEAGADPRWARSDGTTALHTACRGSPLPSAPSADHMQCIQLLLEAGAHLDAPTLQGVTPLHEAVVYEHPANALMLLAAGADPSRATSAGEGPLHTACRNQDYDMAWLLLAAGASPNAASRNGDTPLHMARGSSTTARKSLVQLLLEEGADVNTRGHNGRTPLFGAGSEADIELLLAAGADVHARDSTGQTALHECWGADSAARLLAAGADVNARDASGESLLHKIACTKCPWEQQWRVLLDAGADPNVANAAGVTPILYLRHYGSPCNEAQCCMAAALLAAGADASAAATQPFTHPLGGGERPAGTTFLHLHVGCGGAYSGGVSRCVQLALQAGANVRAVDGKGQTPLDLAAWSDDNLQALLAAEEQQQEQQAQQQSEQQQHPKVYVPPPPPPPLHSKEHFPPLGTPSRPAEAAAPALETADGFPAPPEHLHSAAASASGTAALPSRDQGGPAAQYAAPGAAGSVQQREEQGRAHEAGSCAAPLAADECAAVVLHEELAALPVRELKGMLRALGIDHSGCTEKRELVELLVGHCAWLAQQGGQQAQHGHHDQRAQVGDPSGAACCGSEGCGSAGSSAGAAAHTPSTSQEQLGGQKQEQTGSALQPGAVRTPQVDRRCACCGATPGPGVRLKLCCGCRSVRYCGNACQQQAWPQHKAACRAVQQGG